MAEENDDQEKKKRFQQKSDKPLVLPKSAADKQRMQIAKLMSNPVSLICLSKLTFTWHETMILYFVNSPDSYYADYSTSRHLDSLFSGN